MTVPKLYLQHLQAEPLQGQTNEDLERQRNDALAKLKAANDQLDKIGKWSDDEANRSTPSQPQTKPSSFQLLKSSLKEYTKHN